MFFSSVYRYGFSNTYILDDFVLPLFLGIIISSILSIFIGLAVYGFSEKCTTNKVELISISDSVGSSGRFTLGTSRIESEMDYFSYIKEGNGYKVFKILNDSSTILIENESEKAIFDTGLWGFKFCRTPINNKIISVPKGTIIKSEYELDLK